MKLVILDRDGVINQESDDYIKSVEEWHPIDGSLEAIAQLSQAGWQVFVASNQAGIGRGLFDYDALFAIHETLCKRVAALGGRVDGIEFAPEHPDQASEMRKPNPGMLLDIGQRLGVSVEGLPFVGDSYKDVQAAQNAGARPILVRTGRGSRTEKEQDLSGIEIFDRLSDVASHLLATT